MSPKTEPSRKQNRKGDNPIRVSLITDVTQPCSGSICSSTWICRNSACRAVLSIVETFCKRCSCCICHLFDENKDPSLWLECTSDDGESCGLSCHIECALQRGKVGVVDYSRLMRLDGSYCCASCGKISEILGYWKKQLTIAKDCRRVDNLCYRIYLSYRLFDGTSRFLDLHNIVKDAKNKLETEVGPLSGVSAKMARGIVSRLSVAGEVQELCYAAIQKADEISATLSSANLDGKDDSVPAACTFTFDEITASSVVLILVESSAASSSDIIGFKLWYSKTIEETHTKDPISIFPRFQRRILISNLQPCTEYSFRIIPYTKTGDLGHSEAKCHTSSVEILHKNPDDVVPQNEGTSVAKNVEPDSRFKVRDLGNILQLSLPNLSGLGQTVNTDTSIADKLPCMSHGLDLNITTVPDLNEDVAPPNDSYRNEVDHGSGGSEIWAQQGLNRVVPAVDSRDDVSRKRPASTDIHDCVYSASRNIRGPGNLDENFEYCVKVIRSIECQGYITQEFRLKLLTWFSLRSTEQERRVVNTYIHTLLDDPRSLAGQLVDTFADIIQEH
ncbi:hypothetical protein R6Q57_008132 [Mikania cordata]